MPGRVAILAIVLAALGGAPGLAGSARAGEGGAQAAPLPGSPAAWIDRANSALLPTDSMRARGQLTTDDGYGGKSSHALEMLRARIDGAERTLIRLQASPGGEDLVYEILAAPGQPLERWVWLPSVRRLRQLTGAQRADSFLGTEFSYEDLGLALPPDRRAGSTRELDAAGTRYVELTSPPYLFYSRVVTRIDPATGLPTRVSFYDLANQLVRVERFERVHSFGGHPFPTRIVCEDRVSGGHSQIDFDSVEFDVAIPHKVFTESVIRRRLAAAKAKGTSPAPSP